MRSDDRLSVKISEYTGDLAQYPEGGPGMVCRLRPPDAGGEPRPASVQLTKSGVNRQLVKQFCLAAPSDPGQGCAPNMDFHTLVDHTLWATLQWSMRIDEIGWAERPAGLLSHIVLGEGMWLDRIERRRLNGAIFTVLSRADLEEAARRQAEQAHRLLRDRGTKVIAYTRLSGESGEATVCEVIVHTITHGFHHRGQIASWFAQQQLPYPTTDLIQFLRTRGMTPIPA